MEEMSLEIFMDKTFEEIFLWSRCLRRFVVEEMSEEIFVELMLEEFCCGGDV